MARTPTALLSPADRERLRALRVMKGIALGALLALAVVFVAAFLLQERVPALAYVRAAAEGGMVGALADWFAVTALFRRPLGLPIPHTAIIPNRKDEIGATLGAFIETEFLHAGAVRAKLESAQVSARLGGWLARPHHAQRVVEEAATLATAVLGALSDDDVQEVIAQLAREHLLEPDWGPPAGVWLGRVIDAGAHHGAVDLAADTISTWLQHNRAAFEGLISRRLPAWVPSVAHRFVDDTAHREAVRFVDAVRADPRHPARLALDGYLTRLAASLQHDPATIGRLEDAKRAVFDNPRVRELAAQAWDAVKTGLLAALADPASTLRLRAADAVRDLAGRLQTDAALRARVDGWVASSAAYVVERYRHDIAGIVTDTVARWDPHETSQKLELMVGRDLQYIRLNGTIVGSIAGLAIYTLAQLLLRASA